MKKIISIKDCRKIVAHNTDVDETIDVTDIPINSIMSFKTKMENIGYDFVSETFFIKRLNNNIELNITYREGQIKSITCYQNDELIEIPENLKQQALTDIQNCNQ